MMGRRGGKPGVAARGGRARSGRGLRRREQPLALGHRARRPTARRGRRADASAPIARSVAVNTLRENSWVGNLTPRLTVHGTPAARVLVGPTGAASGRI